MDYIPKIIHYCWFGGKPLPELAQKCIASWRKYCPDYEIKEWNEGNIDLSSVDYMREAYEEKVWGFVPDVARLQIIYNNGGIYLDTDVEIIKNFDDLLINSAFFGIEEGRGRKEYCVNLGLGFGAEKGNQMIEFLLKDYQKRHFRTSDGTLDRTPSPQIQTMALYKKGFISKDSMQKICDATIYPMEYFCPLSYKKGIITITKNTHSIHHYDASWFTEDEKKIKQVRQKIYQKCGHLAPLIWLFVHIILKVQQDGLKKTFFKAIIKIKAGQ